jgi:hypothetical protein
VLEIILGIPVASKQSCFTSKANANPRKVRENDAYVDKGIVIVLGNAKRNLQIDTIIGLSKKKKK